ncbi:hypothetical protein L1887_25767 [Cichorium endivia]|nr:hypothetical protein L1887_25767 [Cichorium endivia]
MKRSKVHVKYKQIQPTVSLVWYWSNILVAACKSAREDGAVDPLQSFYGVTVISFGESSCVHHSVLTPIITSNEV